MALVAGGGSCWDVGGREKDGWAFVLSHRIIIIITLHKLAARRNSISIFFALSSFRVWGRGTDFCSNFLPSIHLLTAQPAVAPPSNNILLGEEQEGERGSGVRFNRVGIICRRGLPSNLRHITTNGFGALRKRLVGAPPLKLSFCGRCSGAPTDPTAVKVRNWGPRVIFVQSSFLRPSLGVV